MFRTILAQIESQITRELFVRAFTEWDRRYREEPEAFESDMARIMRGQTEREYGETAARYFIELLLSEEQKIATNGSKLEFVERDRT